MEDNIYAQILDGQGEEDTSALKQSMFAASKTQPDAAAQDQSLAQQTGLPSDVVSRNKDTVQKKSDVESIDYGYLIDKNPGLSSWLKNPDNSAVGHDDLGSLKRHEDVIKEFGTLEMLGRSLVSGAAGTGASIARLPAFMYDFQNFGDNLALKALGQGDKQIRSPDWLRNNPVAKWLDVQQEAWKTPDLDKNIIEETMRGNYGAAGRSMLAQLAANAPLLVGMIAAGPEVGIAVAGAVQGSAANKVAQESGVDPVAATTDAVLQGGLEALFERAGTFGILKRWEGAIFKTAGKQASKQVMKEFGKTLAYSALAEGNEELWTQAGQDFSDYITGVNPDALKGIWSRALNNAVVGAASGVGLVSPAGAVQARYKLHQNRQAERAKEFYLALGDSAEASKLRERLPEAHRQYVESLVKDTPVENVYIPVEAWDVYMQSKGVDPAAAANEAGVSQEYDQAKEIGKDIKIPLATWANKVVGTEYYQGLADDIKFDPAAQTAREAKIASEQLRADIEKASKEAEQVAKSETMTPEAQKIVTEQADQVAKNVAEQLKATGRFNDEDIKHLSSLWGNFSRVFGGRQGMMPLDYFQKNPLSVKASDSIEAKPGQTELNQDASAFSIGDQVEYQEPGGKFYTGRIKKINGNMATIYNDAAKRNYKINLTLATKKPTKSIFMQSSNIGNALKFAEDAGLVSTVDDKSNVGFIYGDKFINLSQHGTHERLARDMGFTDNSSQAVEAGMVRVHHQFGGGNFEVAAGNEAGYDAINAALAKKGPDGFKGRIYIDLLGISRKTKTVDFTMKEFIERGGDVRSFLPNEGANIYFQGGFRKFVKGLGFITDETDTQYEVGGKWYSKRTITDDMIEQANPADNIQKTVDAATHKKNFKNWFGKSKIVDENKKPKVLYHGSTHVFDTFSLDRANVENHLGKAFYFTDSKTDVSTNYAGEGPDLTSRIDQRSERIFQEMFDGKKEPKYGSAAYEKAMNKARDAAKKELSGGNPTVYQVYVKMENPVILDGPKATRFELNYDDETGQESGNAMELYDAVNRAAMGYGVDGQKIWNDIASHIGELSDFSAKEFDNAFRESEQVMYIEDPENGSLAGNDFIKEVYKEAGFDGIIMNADEAFGSARKMGKEMAMDEGTHHYIVFDPKNIKSVDNNGEFSPFNANIYMQGGGDPLGAILFGKEGGFDMRLLKDMNYSTFLHETGHAFLEMLRRVASQADAPADIQDMSEKTLKWFGIESWDQLERKHHEQFAQGFEKYLFEGKAPSEGLRAAFARFRVWLISVYKSLQGINVQLSDDIRGVMDRMIATDDEIAQAQAEQGLDPMIQDPLSILGEEKGKRYIDAINETRQEAEATLQLKLMEDYQRARKSWWMDELKKVHAQVAQEVNARPEQIALSILQRGKMPDGTDVPEDMKGLKISADDLVRFYSNKYDIDVTATDTTALAAEFDVEQLEGTLRDIEQFRKDVGKVRKYDDGYLAEELAKMPRRYVTASKFANTLDETASSMGFESDMALLDRMIENEIAYKSVAEELVLARKKLRSINKEERAVKYKAIKDAMSALPRGITSKDGLSVHVVGQLFGYSFPEQFLDILSRTPKRNNLIKQIAIDRMVDQYGQLYGDKQEMHDQAMQAIHNEKREQLLRMELDYLASQHTPVLKDLIKTVSARIPSSQMVKKYAADIIGKSALNEISPYQYQLAERRSAKAAGVALTQGKFDEAFEHKRKELLNYELYRAATTAREDIKKAMTDFKKISKSDSAIAKNRDLDYVNAARSILAMYGIGEGSEDPYQFIKNTQAYDPDTFETISALIDSATENVGNYLTITYDQFSNLKEAIDAIWEIARRIRQIQIEDQKMDIDEVRKHLIDRIQVMTKKEKAGYTKSASENDKFARAIMGAIAQGRRVESWVDVMDGGDSKGWFTRAIWNPIVEGTQRFRIENKNYTQKFLELVKPIEKTLNNKEIVSDELRHIFQSKAELLGALLHTGNESNLSKLLRGRGWGMYLEDGTLDTSRWDTFIKRMQDTGVLTKQDYDFVQSIWDLFEELKPASQKAHKEMYGHYFNSITTREFTTPWGTYRGGYAPAIADPFVSEDAAIRKEKSDAEQTNNSYMFPTTGRGFTKGRVERYAAPLAMDLRLVPQQINKVLRFTYIEPRVKDVGRIIRNQEFREFLRDLDPVVGQQMLSPWLQRAAQQIIETPDKSWAGWRVWRELRTRSGINIMAGNVVNTLQQFTGLSIAAIKVHPKYLRNSLWNYMRNPKSVSDAVHEQSEFMRTRSTTHIIEIQKNIDDIILNQAKYSKALDFAKQHGYFLQQATQNIVDLIVWPGAYDQSVAQGNSHDQAVRDADAAVRLTQGDFSAENVSNIESGNALARMFMMFYSYFNMQANLLGTEFAKVSRELGLKRGAGRALYIYMFGFMIPAVVSELIAKSLSGEDWDKDDDGYLDDALSIFFGSQFRTATAMFPFVGQVVTASVNKFNNKWYDDDIRLSPSISMIESAFVGTPFSVYKAIAEEGSKKAAIRDTLSLLSILSGLPVSPLSRPLGYLSEVSEGNVYPENALDFSRGLITGKTGK